MTTLPIRSVPRRHQSLWFVSLAATFFSPPALAEKFGPAGGYDRDLGFSMVAADFDGDGVDDFAMGVPNETVGNVAEAGAVYVIRGDYLGDAPAFAWPHPTAVQWSQDSLGMWDSAEAGEQFGSVTAAGDFNGDGYADLVVGHPFESVGSINGAGAVVVSYGTAGGLTATNNQIWHQDSPGIEGECEEFDFFGLTVAAGDFNHDGYDDLAIGSPYEDLGSTSNAGMVHVLFGRPTGLTSSGSQAWHQGTPGITGNVEADDRFGDSLATGDFDGDGYGDLLIGVTQESIGSINRAGSVNVIYGSITGLTSSDNQTFHQATAGIAGAVEADDYFGGWLTVGDFDSDGYDDAVIAVLGEDIGAISDAGSVNVIYGSPAGLSAVGDQAWHQNSSGILEESEVSDRFGSHLTTGDFNSDGYDDLAVAASNEKIGAVYGAGVVHIIFGGSGGLTSQGNRILREGDGAIDLDHGCLWGIAGQNERLGFYLASGDFSSPYSLRDGYKNFLFIGVPHNIEYLETSPGKRTGLIHIFSPDYEACWHPYSFMTLRN